MNQPHANTPATPPKMAETLLALMQALTAVLDEETVLLGKQDFAGVEALRERKARLARDYQVDIKTLAQKPDLLKAEPDAIRAKLRAMGENLAEATQRNATILKAAIGATQALVQTVMDAALKETKKNRGYTDPRKTPLMLGAYSPLCEPVAVSRTV